MKKPSMCLHKSSGQAVVILPDASGKRRYVYLGEFGSTEARDRYRAVLAAHMSRKPVPSGPVTVARLCAEFLIEARMTYQQKSGTVNRSVVNLETACAHMLGTLRDRNADSLGSDDFVALRDRLSTTLIRGTKKTLSRRHVNRTMGVIRHVVHWGVRIGLVHASVAEACDGTGNIPRGARGVREKDPSRPVDRASIDAVIPHLPSTLVAAIEILWWSGMRAGELCLLRGRDVVLGGDGSWSYRPPKEEYGTWKGRDRVVQFPPECVAIVASMAKADPDAFLFSPRRIMAERRAERRAQRLTKIQPSQVARAKRNAAKDPQFKEKLDVASMRRAVARSCDAAGVARFGLEQIRKAALERMARKIATVMG